jgi:hypothetical protein
MWELYTRTFPYHDEHPIKVVTKIVAGYRPMIPTDCPEKYREASIKKKKKEENKRKENKQIKKKEGRKGRNGTNQGWFC